MDKKCKILVFFFPPLSGFVSVCIHAHTHTHLKARGHFGCFPSHSHFQTGLSQEVEFTWPTSPRNLPVSHHRLGFAGVPGN